MQLAARLGLALALARLASPAPAAACSCSGTAISRSEPRQGATDVELNRAIVILGSFRPESLRLEDAAGAAVPFDATHGPTPGCPGSLSELIPRQPLRPDTQYRVHLEPAPLAGLDPRDQEPTSLSFTTGTRMLPDPELTPPHAAASLLSSVPSDGFSCADGSVYACVSGDLEDVEIIARSGERPTLRWLDLDTDNTFSLQNAPDCIELRRRSPTGKRSAPLMLCGSDLPRRVFQDRDRDRNQIVLCREGRIGAQPVATDAGLPAGDAPAKPAGADAGDSASNLPAAAPAARPDGSASSGCSVRAPVPHSEPAPVVAVLVLGWLALRRRR